MTFTRKYIGFMYICTLALITPESAKKKKKRKIEGHYMVSTVCSMRT